jgi:cytoplasmic iron level regulating protein YaaA (DUF328/UPF0246 family)
MYLLLPPSESKTTGGDNTWHADSGRFGESLTETRELVLSVLHDPATRPKGSRWDSDATKPAHRRYSGVVWQHLDPESLDPAAAAVAAQSVVVLSALGGLFSWDDPVPAYKLKMSATAALTGRFSRLWYPHLAGLLQGPVFDLTALEQTAALQRPDRSDWVRIELVDPRGGRSGHRGKAAKGRLVRAMLTHGPDILDDYLDPDGYSVRLS